MLLIIHVETENLLTMFACRYGRDYCHIRNVCNMHVFDVISEIIYKNHRWRNMHVFAVISEIIYKNMVYIRSHFSVNIN